MAKSLTQTRTLQEEQLKSMVTVQMPLPLMVSLKEVQAGFFALCVRVSAS